MFYEKSSVFTGYAVKMARATVRSFKATNGSSVLSSAAVFALVLQLIYPAFSGTWVAHAASPVTLAANQTVASSSVTTPDNGWVSDNVWATFDRSSDNAEYGFADFGIPSGSVINGIEAFVEGHKSGTNGRNLTVALWNASNSNPDTYTSSQTATLLKQSSDGPVITLGGPTNLWGKTWTLADFADATFKVKVQATSSGGGGSNYAYLDQIRIKVYYTEVVPPPTPGTNPTLSQSCGLDVALVVDTSGSIDDTEIAQMKSALTSFTSAFTGTPTVFSLTKFSTTASIVQSFSMTPSQAASAISGLPIIGSGFTNWQDGLLKAQSTFNHRPNPDLVIFASDGNPNQKGNPAQSVSETEAVNAAMIVANSLKTSGTRIITLGIGNDLNATNLEKISSADAVYTSNFSTLAADLAALADDLCGGTITVTKIIDADGNPLTAGDQTTSGTPVTGWNFDVAGATKVTDVNGQTVPKEVDAGVYSVTETVQTGYSVVGASCSNQSQGNEGTWDQSNAVTGIDVAANDIVSCTFYNAPLPTLTVTKTTVGNDSDSSQNLGPSDFSIHVKQGETDVSGSPAAGSPSGTAYTLQPGEYTVSEDEVSGYTGNFSGCGSQGYFFLHYGDQASCSIVNSENPPEEPTTGTLVVTKVVVNDNGGTTTASGFTITVEKDQVAITNPTPTTTENSATYTYTDLLPGSYHVGENEDTGYTPNFLQCGGTEGAHEGNVTVTAGQTTVYTITNDDKQGTLIVKKVLAGDGQASADDFSFTVNNGESIAFESDAQNDIPVNAGSYTVTEVNILESYAASYSNCTEVSVPNGGEATCTITNTYQPPVAPTGTIEVCKYEDTDGDGQPEYPELQQLSFVDKIKNFFISVANATVLTPLNALSGWTINISGAGDFSDSKVTGENGCVQFADLSYGTYTITETAQANWNQTYPSDPSSITVNLDSEYQSGYYFLNHYTEPTEPVLGCTDPSALNYNQEATENDGSCQYRQSSGGGGGGGGGGSPLADLAVTIGIPGGDPVAGSTFIYHVTLSNLGPSTATNAVVTDVLPSVLTYASYSAAQGSYDSTTNKWSVGTLAVGASTTLDLTVSLASSASGSIANFVSAISSENDPVLSNNTATYTFALGEVAGATTEPTPQVLGATDTALPRTGGMPQAMFLTWLAPLLKRKKKSLATSK